MLSKLSICSLINRVTCNLSSSNLLSSYSCIFTSEMCLELYAAAGGNKKQNSQKSERDTGTVEEELQLSLLNRKLMGARCNIYNKLKIIVVSWVFQRLNVLWYNMCNNGVLVYLHGTMFCTCVVHSDNSSSFCMNF